MRRYEACHRFAHGRGARLKPAIKNGLSSIVMGSERLLASLRIGSRQLGLIVDAEPAAAVADDRAAALQKVVRLVEGHATPPP